MAWPYGFSFSPETGPPWAETSADRDEAGRNPRRELVERPTMALPREINRTESRNDWPFPRVSWPRV